MPYIITTSRPEPIPRDYRREVPCGHPADPVAMYTPEGAAACHCGAFLFFEDALTERPPEAPGPIVPCSKCGCYVAVPESPPASRRAVATLEEAREAAEDAALEHNIHGDINSFDMDAAALPESGGTVGPLPDGTLIEVERVTCWQLLARIPASEAARLAGPDYAERESEAIAAFNAREAER